MKLVRRISIAALVLPLAACNLSTGMRASGGETAPTSPPSEPPSELHGTAAVQALNAIRSDARDCGGEFMPAVADVGWSDALEDAAQGHSDDLAENLHDSLSHTGSDGLGAGERIANVGYNAAAWAENIAAGTSYDTVDAVMAGWLDSPGHCRNLMNPNVTEIGLALTTAAETRYRHYWTLKLARPQN